MQEEIEKIAQQFERVFNRYQAVRKQPIRYDDGTTLFRSELHMIEAVGAHENINVSKLANLLGITKGAVSQCVGKLCKKGMMLKQPSPLTDNEVALKLTERGKQAFVSHEDYHKRMYEDFQSILGGYPEEARKALIQLLSKFESYLE